jgi:MFS family permease
LSRADRLKRWRANGVFGVPSFLRFWVGQVISETGDVFGELALPLIVYERTGSVAVMAGMTVAAMLPNLVVSPWSGILADRLDRKPIMMLTDVSRALLILLVPWFSATWQFLVCWFLLSALRQLFEQGRFGLIPALVPAERLVNANLFSHGSAQAVALAGPGLAGFVIAWMGVRPALYIDAVSFLLSAGFIWSVALPPREPNPPFRLRLELTQGWRVIRNNPALRFSAALVAAVMIGSMPVNVLRVPFLMGTLKAGASGYGLAISAFSAAALVGTGLSSLLAKRFNRVDLIVGSILLTTFVTVGYVLSPVLIVAIGFFALMGLLNGITNPLNATLIQEQTPANFHGRVFGWYTALATALSLITTTITGALGERFPVRNVLLGACVVYIAGAVSGYALPWYQQARNTYLVKEPTPKQLGGVTLD